MIAGKEAPAPQNDSVDKAFGGPFACDGPLHACQLLPLWCSHLGLHQDGLCKDGCLTSSE